MSSTDGKSPTLMQQRPFILFWFSRVAVTISYFMLVVAIGWTVYELTNSPLQLGLIGLIQFIPNVILTLLVGHAADRYDRRHIVVVAQAFYVLAALVVLTVLVSPIKSVHLLFLAAFMLGCARSFELPAGSALVPSLVPQTLISRAIAAWSSANQTAVISGPALGGLIYGVSPALVCAVTIVLCMVASVLVLNIKVERPPVPRDPPTLASMFAGFEYIRTRPRLLGIITLDLVVVLFGGVTALLPIYARDILNAGPEALGLLRSAPAIGALITTVTMAHIPIERHIGAVMFGAVGIFGVATLVFATSTSLPLSMVALAILGASDSFSVVIRFSLVQIETPDEMRGRVGAINYLFVNASNTLGEFRAGAIAALIGAVPSALVGGIGSLLVAALWMMMFPALRRVDRYEPADKPRGS